MNIKQVPEIGNWYQPIDRPLLRIIAVDSEDETIEIQYLDDAIEEFDFDAWDGMEPELIDASDNLSYTYYDIDNGSPTASLLELVDSID